SENADPDALIIPGVVHDDCLGDEVRVTVIATGFQRSLKAADSTVRQETRRGAEDYLTPDEWKRITEVPSQKKQYLMGRNDPEDELDIPTVLRDKRYQAERNEA
ncbi:MAG TPA: hypothetical protein PLB56_09550, partial [Spirochaetales bacterium]|nr:hypothetical protein [Spirochaetales bacterium]